MRGVLHVHYYSRWKAAELQRFINQRHQSSIPAAAFPVRNETGADPQQLPQLFVVFKVAGRPVRA